MANASRRARTRVDIWPGYVDAMAALLMVVIFLLLVFVTAQVLLSRTVSQQDTELVSLRQRLSEITELLGLERAKTAGLEEKASALGDLVSRLLGENEELVGQVESLTAERTALLAQLNDQQRRIGVMESDLEGLSEARQQLESQVSSLSDNLQTRRAQAEDLMRERNQLQSQLEDTRDTLARRSGELDEERRLSAAARAELALLNQQIAALRQQLDEIGRALAAAEADKSRQAAEIQDLGRRLNLALAREVNRLSQYQSEFFGRLREVLGDNPDIRVEGDRFVLSSELLFASGTDRLGEPGQAQLLRLATTLRDLAARIPADIDWVLRVDGHTDRLPINTPRFPSNWELSTARAVSVVRFLIDQGIAPDRLVAAGFGEHRPLDPANTAEAYARNRRIEFKLTSR